MEHTSPCEAYSRSPSKVLNILYTKPYYPDVGLQALKTSIVIFRFVTPYSFVRYTNVSEERIVSMFSENCVHKSPPPALRPGDGGSELLWNVIIYQTTSATSRKIAVCKDCLDQLNNYSTV